MTNSKNCAGIDIIKAGFQPLTVWRRSLRMVRRLILSSPTCGAGADSLGGTVPGGHRVVVLYRAADSMPTGLRSEGSVGSRAPQALQRSNSFVPLSSLKVSAHLKIRLTGSTRR